MDDIDFALVEQYNWRLLSSASTEYAYAIIAGQRIMMHNLLCPTFVEPDHKNRNGLDNRRDNLRDSDRSHNNANQIKREGCSSQYKGVCFFKPKQRWRARIQIYGKERHLGYFLTELEAAIAYNNAAVGTFGDYARTNAI